MRNEKEFIIVQEIKQELENSNYSEYLNGLSWVPMHSSLSPSTKTAKKKKKSVVIATLQQGYEES